MAATSRITSVIAASGRVMVRATAKLRSVASSTATTAVTASPVWIALEEPQLLGARPQDERDRRAAVRRASRPAASGVRQRRELLAVQTDVGHRRTLPAASPRQRSPVRRGQRGREDLAVHAERDVAAGELLQLARERVVEQEADAERAEDLRLREADRRSAP